MSLLKDILSEKPEEWSEASYAGASYVMVKVLAHSDEYKLIQQEYGDLMRSRQIIEISRVQHPFAYGRYKLHKEQLTCSNTVRLVPHERKLGLTVKKNNFHWFTDTEEGRSVVYAKDLDGINMTLKYNFDHRRNGCTTYPHPAYCYAIIYKVLDSLNGKDETRYPEYVLKFECDEISSTKNDNILGSLSRLQLH